MTEKEAWLYLGRLWECISRICNDNVIALWFGLCLSIKTLEIPDKISMKIRCEMLRKVDCVKRLPDSEYCWPRTKSGAAERAAFCRKMARECE